MNCTARERPFGGDDGLTDDAPVSATDEKKVAVLREAVDVGIAELDADLGLETTPAELMAEVCFEVGIERAGATT